VIERPITQGELVSPDKESLLTLADLSTLYVLADIPEARLADIKPGALAILRIAAVEEPLHGKVSFIAPTINSATRTAEVRVEVKNDKGNLRPGMFAQVEIAESSGQSGKPVLTVPGDALLVIDGHPSVFVPGDAPNEFAKREVKVGRTVGDFVEILSGLKEGDKVATAGASILKAELTKPAKEEE
jgi:cobalt-zinc-cadmium efflux system membrane fusion protein